MNYTMTKNKSILALIAIITACATQQSKIQTVRVAPDNCNEIKLLSSSAPSEIEAIKVLKEKVKEAGGNVLVLLPESAHEIKLSHGIDGATPSIEVLGYAYSCPRT